MKKYITKEEITDYLNYLLELDRYAMDRLFLGSKVECNKDMAKDKTTYCGINYYNHPTLSVLGIINSLFAEEGDKDPAIWNLSVEDQCFGYTDKVQTRIFRFFYDKEEMNKCLQEVKKHNVPYNGTKPTYKDVKEIEHS